MKTNQPCICITGPTACGKTELALRVAEKFPIEVISMDSAMVYRGMDIGTAKPSPQLQQQTPHHLIDIVEPTESYSAGRFARDAQEAVVAIHGRGNVPVLVGGTFLYLRSFRDGLAQLPEADPDVRQRLDEEAELLGWAAMHQRLMRVDPSAANRISPMDRQRIQRALEVYELTGTALSVLQTCQGDQPAMPVRALAMFPEDRVRTAERIAQRFDSMVAAGFVDEVRSLRNRGDLEAATPAMRAVGYRQIWAHLEGTCEWDEAREKALTATRRLAKRQMTWLRSEADVELLPTEAHSATEAVARELQALLN